MSYKAAPTQQALAQQPVMDGNLLLSVLGGLGRIAISDDWLETYIRDDDCLGEHPAHIITLPGPSCLDIGLHWMSWAY